MELGRFFSLRDFFSYYIAGVIWFIDAYLLRKALVPDALSDVLKNIRLERIVFGICIVIFPYVVGFIFSGIGDCLSKMFYCCFGGDPLDWVFNYTDKKYKGKRLSGETRRRCSEFIDRLFEIGNFEEKPSSYFYLTQLSDFVI